jgi:hypothetical protein
MIARTSTICGFSASLLEKKGVTLEFDDLIGSSSDEDDLRITYKGILEACQQANLAPNEAKLIEPANAIIAFNCHLTHGQANVTEQRIQKFIDEARGPRAETSFIDYCIRVQQLNHAALV